MEAARCLYEDRETFEIVASEHLLRDTKSQERRVLNQHAAKACIERILDTDEKLARQLQEPGLLSQDVCEGVGTESFNVFYDQLRSIKEYHRRHPNVQVSRPSLEANEALLPRDIVFSGTERNGRHLDLHQFYDSFLNLQRVKLFRARDAAYSLSYREYCSSFFEFDNDAAGKRHEDYQAYLQDLVAYLVDFLRRAQPLLDVAMLMRKIAQESEEQYDKGSFCSWGEGSSKGDALWCEACDNRFAKETSFKGHLTGKKHKQNLKRFQANGAATARTVFLLEVKVSRLCDSLTDVLEGTIAEIDKKQSRTLREQIDAMEMESESDEEDEEDDEDEEQGFVRQIKNYPTGWDGEPIPYWLYRLHGLGVGYNCEICGGTTYWGRRAFERHFEEFRHTSSLKLLGLEPGPAFFDVVRIQDALDLNKKLEADKAKQWRPEEEEEVEDADGRVYNRKTYELLLKQGVIRPKKMKQRLFIRAWHEGPCCFAG